MNVKLVLIAVGILCFGLFAGLQSISYGWSTLSISQVTIDSNDPKLMGEAYLVTVALTGSSQATYGETTKARLDADPSDLATADTSPTIGFILESVLDYQQCIYDIIPSTQTSTEYIYKIGQVYVLDIFEFDLLDREWKKNDFIRQCTLDNGQVYEKPGWVFVCFPRYEVGLMGNMDAPTKSFQSTLTLTLDNGKSESKKISFPGATSTSLGDFAFVEWVGNFETGLECPSESNYRAFYSYQTGGWKTIHEGKFRAYENYVGGSYASWEGISFNGWDYCIERWKRNEATVIECAEEWNNFADLFNYEDKISDAYSQFDEGDSMDGRATVSVNDALFFPVLTLHIKASELGIIEPVGDPHILSLSSLPFKAGEQGSITAHIENEGTGMGSFELFAECTNGFNPDRTVYFNLGINDDIERDLLISCDTVDKELRGGCTVVVRERNNPTKQESQTVLVKCSPHQICEPGKQECDGLTLYQCNDAGTGWEAIQYQSKNCETQYEGGGWPSLDDFGFDLGDLSSGLLDGIWTLRAIITLIIILIILGLMAYVLIWFKFLRR